MNVKNNTRIIISVLLCVVAGILLAIYFSKQTPTITSTDEPVDVVLDFYESWLKAELSTSTNPYQDGLDKAPILSKALSEQLTRYGAKPTNDVNPVLCQTTIPLKINARDIVTLEDKAQVLVLAEEQNGQAEVSLLRNKSGWYIDDITCNVGEFTPERDFSFEQEGQLLKNVPEALDSNYWYLVFEENGQQEHSTPLFFDAESICVVDDATLSTCDESTFTEGTRVYIQGQMDEAGVQVQKLELRT